MCFLDVSAHIQSFLTVSDRFQSVFCSSRLSSESSLLSSENVFFRRFSPYSVISDRFWLKRLKNTFSPFLTVFSRFHEVHFCPLRILFFRRFSPYSVISDRFWLKRLKNTFSPFLTVFSRFHEVHFCPLRMGFLDVSAHIQSFLTVSG